MPTINLIYTVPTYTVSGTVTAKGDPVKDQMVSSIYSKGTATALANATTDADGKYTFAAVSDVPDETDRYVIKTNATSDYEAYESAEFEEDGVDITGKPGNLFDPQGRATRAEVATIFAKSIELLAK